MTCREIKQRQAVGYGIDDPGKRDHDAAGADHNPWPEAVNEAAAERLERSFRDDEEGEGYLNGRSAPVIFLIDRVDEERPTVLQVGGHHQADDAKRKLSPARPWGRGCAHAD